MLQESLRREFAVRPHSVPESDLEKTKEKAGEVSQALCIRCEIQSEFTPHQLLFHKHGHGCGEPRGVARDPHKHRTRTHSTARQLQTSFSTEFLNNYYALGMVVMTLMTFIFLMFCLTTLKHTSDQTNYSTVISDLYDWRSSAWHSLSIHWKSIWVMSNNFCIL